MKYNLIDNGVITSKVVEFNAPPDVSHKGLYWYEWVDERNPTFNPLTHKLGDEARMIEGGKAVWRRPVEELTQDAKDAAALAKVRAARKSDYINTLGIDKDFENTTGDVLDVLIAEVYAWGTPKTQAFADMITKIAAIKAAHPKP